MKFIILITMTMAVALAQSNPSPQAIDQARRANYCSDPWITLAIWDLTGNTRNPNGLGNLGECNTQLYNGGSWQNYAQLRRAVDETIRAISLGGGRISLQDNRNGTLTLLTQAGPSVDRLVVMGRVIAQGAGNVIAQGAGNIVSHDGGTLITQDGGDRTVLSAGKTKIRLPGGRAMIVGK